MNFENLVKFKYRMPNTLLPLVQKTVIDYSSDYLNGICPVWRAGQFNNCAMYLVCQFKQMSNTQLWFNPLAVIARNENEAMTIYRDCTGNNDGSILCEITYNCSKIKVEPVDD